MAAVKRPKTGVKGQLKGTVATSPKEIDGIIRKAYGENYKGNARDQQTKTVGYMTKYNKFIYKATRQH